MITIIPAEIYIGFSRSIRTIYHHIGTWQQSFFDNGISKEIWEIHELSSCYVILLTKGVVMKNGLKWKKTYHQEMMIMYDMERWEDRLNNMENDGEIHVCIILERVLILIFRYHFYRISSLLFMLMIKSK